MSAKPVHLNVMPMQVVLTASAHITVCVTKASLEMGRPATMSMSAMQPTIAMLIPHVKITLVHTAAHVTRVTQEMDSLVMVGA